ncbi:MAG: class I SAM-dependent methyltransferase, partial [Cyanobacteria bacterium MAG IRC1_bin_28]|nr:class I SAM-dependent methyltransferase [Cyanobacteria bacterium MAG IRC1_bin_28]
GAADGVMMAYGLRNLASAAAGLRLMRHLLKPHGRGVALDFNRPTHPLWAQAQRSYLQRVVVPVARLLDLEAEYTYLERSIATFATGAQQETLARQAGFAVARHHPVAGGLMGLLELGLT